MSEFYGLAAGTVSWGTLKVVVELPDSLIDGSTEDALRKELNRAATHAFHQRYIEIHHELPFFLTLCTSRPSWIALCRVFARIPSRRPTSGTSSPSLSSPCAC